MAELRDLIERAMHQLDGDPLQQRHWERMWLANLERLGHVTGNPELVREAQVRTGQSFEQTGDFWAGNQNFTLASAFYQESVTAYRMAGGCQANLDAAQSKLDHAVESSGAEMGRVSVSAEIPAGLMDQWRAEVVCIYSKVGLAVLADPAYALPDAAHIRAGAAEAQRGFSLRSMFATTVLQEDRIVRMAASQNEHAALDVSQDLFRQLWFKLGHLTAWAFEAIHEEGSTVRQKVTDFLSESPVLSEQRRPLIDRALERYDAGDYISSIHILVFQIEGILRDFARLLGLPANRMDRDGRTQARQLSDLLYDERLAQTLGESLAESLKAVLVEQSGPNVRNVVGHGMAAPEAFTEQVANLLIALLLQIAAFGPREPEAPEGMPPDPGVGPPGEETE